MNRVLVVCFVCAVLMLFSSPTCAEAGDDGSAVESASLRFKQNEVIIPGKVATGFNRYYGQPIADFGGVLGLAGFTELGVFNPGGDTPNILAPDTPSSALLATYVDPAFLGFVGLGPDDVNPWLVNVPLREVATNIDLGNVWRDPMPGHSEVPLHDNSQAEPAGPIDLATWNRARGVVSVTCDDSGGSEFLLAARNLLPNRLYSIFGIYSDPPENPLIMQPFGGLPNAFVTDAKGRGSIRRTLNGCPLEPPPGEPSLLAIDLRFHSDHMLYGVHPSIPQAGGGLAIGAVSHAHLEFVFSGQALLQPEGWGEDVCLPGNTTYCLQDGRFRVEMTWVDFDNRMGQGKTANFASDDSGFFFFFDRDNWEAMVKVLDGCGFNGHYWVFASASTNVEYTLTVTDTRSGQTKEYENPLGMQAPAITDTQAFATCP